MHNPTHSGQLVITRSKSWTASDTVRTNKAEGNLDFAVKGFSVNADGNVAYKTGDQSTGALDAAVTIAVKAGVLYPISPEIIMSTNTTATGIVVHG